MWTWSLNFKLVFFSTFMKVSFIKTKFKLKYFWPPPENLSSAHTVLLTPGIGHTGRLLWQCVSRKLLSHLDPASTAGRDTKIRPTWYKVHCCWYCFMPPLSSLSWGNICWNHESITKYSYWKIQIYFETQFRKI